MNKKELKAFGRKEIWGGTANENTSPGNWPGWWLKIVKTYMCVSCTKHRPKKCGKRRIGNA